MQNFRFLEHTADIMFEAYGDSFEQAFENAALAMFSILGKAECKRKVKFRISASSLEELTVNALSDLLSYMDIHGVLFSKVKVTSFDGKTFSLEFEACGQKKQPRDSIKAVTYHQLAVQKDSQNRWTIRVLLDV
ncbi:MAG: archease [Candidatus Micrarchaeota archaeon]|nr:archease [Candidatus Micrarchaeota archaeon]